MNRAENRGSWIFFESVNFASTIEDIIKYFRKYGIPLCEDDIDITSRGTLISIPDNLVVDWVNTKLQDAPPLQRWPTVGRRWLMKHEM
jgi:ABC-type uncharacterized transport system substrate-binding protein